MFEAQPPETGPGWPARLLVPAGADADTWRLLAARGLRALADGYMAVLLPAYLLTLGLGTVEVGVVATTTLLSSALATLAVGAWGYRMAHGGLLRAAALVMAATGLGFAGFTLLWPLLVVAFLGTLNPSSGDVSVFLPLEHTRLAAGATGATRTTLFARYSLIGALCAALGALATGLPDVLVRQFALQRLDAMRAMFLLYATIGAIVWLLYRQQPLKQEEAQAAPTAPLGPSRGIVIRLAALFSIDARETNVL